MSEIKIGIEDAFNPSMANGAGDGGNCSEAEPFALQVIDDSMEPEFATGCIVIIDPGGVVRDGSYVFAKDLKGEYIFRQLRMQGDELFLVPLNDLYETFQIPDLSYIDGIISQRAGKKRSYHKWYDK